MAFYLGSCQVDNLNSIYYISNSFLESENLFLQRQFSQYSSNISAIGAYAFYSYSALTSISLSQAISIGDNAFYRCGALTSVSLSKATSIGSYAFAYCSALTSISLPQATSIGNHAFYSCLRLASINLPQATSIGSNAFTSCISLASVSLPKATLIGSSAFRTCYHLLSLYLTGSSIVSLASTTAFTSTPISTYTTSTGGVYGSIFVPASLYNSYKTAKNWSVYSSRFVSV